MSAVSVRILRLIAVVLFVIDIVNSHNAFSNVSRHFRHAHDTTEAFARAFERQSRLLSFKTLDEDIKVDLEFLVPFVKIPVKRSMDAGGEAIGSIVNINTASLLLTGLIVAIGAGVGHFLSKPSLLTGFGKKSRADEVSDHLDPFKFIHRNSKGEKVVTPLNDFMDTVENTFRESNIDITTCIQKSLCSFVKSANENVRRGHGSSTNKIVDGLASSRWLLGFIEGTAIREAIDAGGTGAHCSQKYHHCKWSEAQVIDMVFKYISFY